MDLKAPLLRTTPYSLENFLWLRENSAVSLYLSDESLVEIDEALGADNEQPLRELYPIILEQYVSEREINIGFVLQQESLINDFTLKVEKIGYDVKTDIKQRNEQIEEKEANEAEKMLKEIR